MNVVALVERGRSVCEITMEFKGQEKKDGKGEREKEEMVVLWS